ncbi:uncharacterized protein [Argopecten irradians]|uniref:uncharacterized protein n=1 Tax=Argopecten irradians TaxID=31199 RepID=UPI0037198CAE
MAEGWQITPGQSDLMEEMCRVMGWPIPHNFSLDPMNSPAGLLHWRSLTILASAIPESTMAELRETFALTIRQPMVPVPRSGDGSAPYEVLVVEGEEVQVPDEPEAICFPPAFDAHFHLDRTRKWPGLGDTASAHDVEAASPLVEEQRRVGITGAAELLGHEDQRIQLHCFGGSQDVVHSWLDTFPNTYFSVSGMVHHFQAAQQRALRAIPRDRLILETVVPISRRRDFHMGLLTYWANLFCSTMNWNCRRYWLRSEQYIH